MQLFRCKIAFGESSFRVTHVGDLIPSIPVIATALHRQDAHAKGLSEPCDLAANTAIADDANSFPPQLFRYQQC